MATHSGWEWETSFCVFVLFPVSDSEMKSANSSSVLANQSAMDSEPISSLRISDAFAPGSALELAQESF
jgi:hypothetical protein